MSNPFKYGTVVSGNDFADRRKELKELSAKLKETVRIFLLAPRRYGKTSLIKSVLIRLKNKGFLVVYLDLYWASSSKEFFELYASSVMRGSKSIARRAAHFMKNFLPRLRPRLSIDADGNPELSLDLSADDSAKAAAEVFDLPEKIARAERKRFIVVFDEFQEIMQFGGPVLEKQIRAAIQHHSHVSYLFAGSKTHMLIDMIADETRPFYQMGTLMSLDKIPEKEFGAFIAAKFSKSGRKITPQAVNHILTICENVPHYVQLLCFNLWDHFRGEAQIDETHVQQSLANTLRSQEPAYITLWEGLTLHQRKTLKATAALKGRLMTAKDSIRQFTLESASNVAKSLKALCNKGILRKEKEAYVFEDVFFGCWAEMIIRDERNYV
jgi:AAA+ ATPase superfamily predicted ATPase